ncbi:glycosyltransferase [Nonomuraea sp. CA-218870]|uniref:glycosyltransferase n=1 Tax=Nonomuraea sp. CA-218870 TaxID=3239998 RepID=UPI003D8AE88F
MTRPYVTVVVVSHDGARWLGETLRGLLGQSRRPDRVIGVDNGSRDGSADLLTQALGPGNVRALPRSASFGEAVADALSAAPATGDNEWIWLLHDDCAPDRRALEALLHAADQDRKATVLGPKLRDWLDRRRLLEIGVTVGLTGRRDTGLEPHEFDQGQHDGTREVLSVSTAGMLIRRDVWEAAGGLDPFFPLFRDDLDLCWRVRDAGHRVLVVTDAVAWHAEAAARRRRRITVSGDHPRRLDRRNAIFVVMANLPFRTMLWALARNLAGSLVRTLLFLVGKQPANALDELVALGSILVHPLRLTRARRARRAGRKKGFARVRPLLTPRGAGLRRLADMGRGFLNGDRPVESAGRHHHAAPDGAQDQEELPEDRGAVKRFLGRPGVLLVLALTLVTLVAERSLLGGDRLGGGALVPVTGDAADLWAFYTDGSSGWAPPYTAVVAGLATLAFGQTWAVVSVLLLGTVPLAGASAYLATRRLPAFSRVAPRAEVAAPGPGPASGQMASSASASSGSAFASGPGPDSGRASASGPSPVAGRATVSDLSTAGNLFSAASLFSDAAPSPRPAETPDSARTPDSSETPGSARTSGTGDTPVRWGGGMRARGGKRRRTGRHGRDANGPAEAEPGITSDSGPHGSEAGVLGSHRSGIQGSGVEGLGGDEARGGGPVAGVAVRVWIAATYALLPVATGAVATGRLGTAVVFVLLPAYAVLGAHLLFGDRRRSRRAAWGLGLLLAVGTAFVPIVYVLAAALGAAAAWSLRRRRPEVVTSAGIALAAPVALLLPWLVDLVLDPGRLLLEAGLHGPGLSDARLAPEFLLALNPGGPGVPPFWVTGGLVAAGLAALLVRGRRRAVAAGWAAALFGVLVALVVARVGVSGAPAWPGVPLAVAAAALLVVAGLVAGSLSALWAAGGPRRMAAGLVAAVAFGAPLLAAGHWVVHGVRGPLRPDVPDPLPALAAIHSRGGEQTLLIRGSEFTVLRGRAPLIGEAEVPVVSEARARVRTAAEGLAGGRGGTDAATLAQHGVAMVAVAPPVPPPLAETLDSQPSLQRMSLSEAGGLWRVAEPVTPVPPSSAHFLHTPWLWAQGAMVVAVVVLAAPGRREPEEETEPVPVLAGALPERPEEGGQARRGAAGFRTVAAGGRRRGAGGGS